MRKLVVVATLLLAGTGVFVSYVRLPAAFEGVGKATSLAHIWLGVAYLVIFPLYAWDHIRTNRRWLTAFRATTLSGVVQLTAGIFLLLTGLVLLAYSGALGIVRAFHLWATWPILGALAWHWLSPKAWRAESPRRGR